MGDKKHVVTLSKLYTRSGDDGSTGLVGLARCAKDDRRVESYGEVDELNATLGLAAQAAKPSMRVAIETVQQRLFDLGAHLADGRDEPQIALDEGDVEQLEVWVDEAGAAMSDDFLEMMAGDGTLIRYAAGQAHWQSTTLWKYSGFDMSVGFICKPFFLASLPQLEPNQ